jgi:hypothetical protein
MIQLPYRTFVPGPSFPVGEYGHHFPHWARRLGHPPQADIVTSENYHHLATWPTPGGAMENIPNEAAKILCGGDFSVSLSADWNFFDRSASFTAAGSAPHGGFNYIWEERTLVDEGPNLSVNEGLPWYDCASPLDHPYNPGSYGPSIRAYVGGRKVTNEDPGAIDELTEFLWGVSFYDPIPKVVAGNTEWVWMCAASVSLYDTWGGVGPVGFGCTPALSFTTIGTDGAGFPSVSYSAVGEDLDTDGEGGTFSCSIAITANHAPYPLT